MLFPTMLCDKPLLGCPRNLVNGLFHLLRKWDKDRVNFFHNLLTFDPNPIASFHFQLGSPSPWTFPTIRSPSPGALILARNENWEMLASPGKLHGCPTCPGGKMDLPRDKDMDLPTRKRTPGNQKTDPHPKKGKFQWSFLVPFIGGR